MPREALKTSASKPGVIGVPAQAQCFGARDHFLRIGNVGGVILSTTSMAV
jgi:hypothetical protein